MVSSCIGDHQRLRHEPRHQVDGGFTLYAFPQHTASAASSVKPPAKTASRRNRVCSAEIAAHSSVDRGLQRLLPRQSCAASASQEREALIEPRRDIFDRQCVGSRCSQLEGERNSVESKADGDNRGRVHCGYLERCVDQAARSWKSCTASNEFR